MKRERGRFTGSTKVGKMIARDGGERMLKLQLELGARTRRSCWTTPISIWR